jgi:hypothetical protein
MRREFLSAIRQQFNPGVQLGASDVPALTEFSIKGFSIYRSKCVMYFNACGRNPDRTLLDKEIQKCIGPAYACEMREDPNYKENGWQDHAVLRRTSAICCRRTYNPQSLVRMQAITSPSFRIGLRALRVNNASNMQEFWQALGYVKVVNIFLLQNKRKELLTT